MAAEDPSDDDDCDDDAVVDGDAGYCYDWDACCGLADVGRPDDESAHSSPAARDPIIRRHLMLPKLMVIHPRTAADGEAFDAVVRIGGAVDWAQSPKMSRHASRPDRRPWSIDRHRRSVCTRTTRINIHQLG